MTVKKQNLSVFEESTMPSASNMRFGIVVSEWNQEVTEALLQGAMETLLNQGANADNIIVHTVPGSFELALGAQYLIRNTQSEAILCLGCVVQGETRHFDFISQAVADGIMNVGLSHNVPVVFGVLTTNNMDQALARSGGAHGNKGIEAAATAIRMLALRNKLK